MSSAVGTKWVRGARGPGGQEEQGWVGRGTKPKIHKFINGKTFSFKSFLLISVCPLRFSEFPTALVSSDGNIIWLWFYCELLDTATFELLANEVSCFYRKTSAQIVPQHMMNTFQLFWSEKQMTAKFLKNANTILFRKQVHFWFTNIELHTALI